MKNHECKEVNGDARELVSGYLRYASAACRERKFDVETWTIDAVRRLVEKEPEVAWPLVLELIRRAEDDQILAFIAAGPLEELITAHGERLFGRIETEAAADKRFRRALSGVWGESQMPESFVLRLKQLIRDEPPL